MFVPPHEVSLFQLVSVVENLTSGGQKCFGRLNQVHLKTFVMYMFVSCLVL